MKTMTISFINHEKRKSIALKNARNTSVKKGLLIALVIAMLTVMLASCDEISLFPPNVAEARDDYYIENFKPEDYGFTKPIKDVLNGNNFSKDNNENYSYFLNSVNSAIERGYYGCTIADESCMACWNIVRLDELRRNVILSLEDPSGEDEGWEHNVVSTSDDFVIMSKDKSGKIYFTGLVNGKFRNDAGFIDKETTKALKSLINDVGYDKAVEITRTSTIGMAVRCSGDDGYNGMYAIVDLRRSTSDENGNLLPFEDVCYTIKNITFYKSNTSDEILRIVPEYDIDEDYLDKYVPKRE